MIHLFSSERQTHQKIDSEYVSNYLPKHSKRYQHILGVTQMMKELLPSLSIPDDWKSMLITACYLHDIGYSPKLSQYGFHPLDGAIFAAQQQFPKPIVAAVLFHTGAIESAKEEKDPNILAIYQQHQPLLDEQDQLFIKLVTYCDLQTSPTGERITLQERIDEICDRYGHEHQVSQLMIKNQNYYEKTIQEVAQLIQSQ